MDLRCDFKGERCLCFFWRVRSLPFGSEVFEARVLVGSCVILVLSYNWCFIIEKIIVLKIGSNLKQNSFLKRRGRRQESV